MGTLNNMISYQLLHSTTGPKFDLKKKKFCGDTFYGATGMGFKARVDPSSPVLYSHLSIMILRVNSEFPGLGLVPIVILHLGMVGLLLEWLPNVTGRFEPTTSRPKVRRCKCNFYSMYARRETKSSLIFFTWIWQFNMHICEHFLFFIACYFKLSEPLNWLIHLQILACNEKFL